MKDGTEGRKQTRKQVTPGKPEKQRKGKPSVVLTGKYVFLLCWKSDAPAWDKITHHKYTTVVVAKLTSSTVSKTNNRK